MRLAATAPVQASPPRSRTGRGCRSAIAPTKSRASAETTVATVMVYGARAPTAMGTPSTDRSVVHSAPDGRSGQASARASAVR